MSTAAFNPAPAARPNPPGGATAATGARHVHRVGNALRAVKVFATAAVDVVLLGEYGEEAGVVRRRSPAADAIPPPAHPPRP
ncbi:hypothetical protein [Streptomyces apocyni]|uniref:hypothetical protein n=1 Tax=Streptomyces apocyni TaxID=2654677 RepID=UPI0012EAD703|nr:hypothetical protein [Streptomyces apocyni]